MTRSRIFGIVWTVLAVLYYIASDSWLAPAILLCTVGMALYLALGVLLQARLVSFTLSADEDAVKNMPADCRVVGRNRSILPVANIVVRLSFHNVLTDETEHTDLNMAIAPRGFREIAFQCTGKYAGKVEISISRASICDFLGIFRKTVSPGICRDLYVMPELFSPDVDISSRSAPDMDSDFYSDTKKGYDSGETFGIREYAPGDSTKFIHWKLSSKLDKVLIRELGFPIQNSVLLLLETGFTGSKPEAAAVDAMLAAFLSISHSLCESGLEHHICWYDHSQSRLFDYEISDKDGVQEAAKLVLSAPLFEDELSVVSHYLETYRECQAAHVVYITSAAVLEETLSLLSGSCLTVLKSISEKDAAENPFSSSAISVLPFYHGSICEDLCSLSI